MKIKLPSRSAVRWSTACVVVGAIAGSQRWCSGPYTQPPSTIVTPAPHWRDVELAGGFKVAVFSGAPQRIDIRNRRGSTELSTTLAIPMRIQQMNYLSQEYPRLYISGHEWRDERPNPIWKIGCLTATGNAWVGPYWVSRSGEMFDVTENAPMQLLPDGGILVFMNKPGPVGKMTVHLVKLNYRERPARFEEEWSEPLTLPLPSTDIQIAMQPAPTQGWVVQINETVVGLDARGKVAWWLPHWWLSKGF